MTAKRILIPEDDADTDKASAPMLKRYFEPGKLMKEVREAKSKAVEKQTDKSVENISSEPGDTGSGTSAIGRTSSSLANANAPPGTSFEAAFANLKGSKFYEPPPEPKATSESPKKIESYPLKTNSVLVNSRQKGNPLLKSIRSVPWEFSEIEPDYIMGQTTCALFLSLRYFKLYPNYIHERLKALGKSFQLRILLVQVDVTDPYPSLRDISRIAIYTDCTLILAWSSEEAGRYIETYKVLENKPSDLLMEKQEDSSYSKIIDTLTMVKSVNRTNAATLLTTYRSLDKILKASPDELALLPGMGPLKANKLHSVINQPFLKTKTT